MSSKDYPKHSSVAKKPRKQYGFPCPNPQCGKGFQNENGWNKHIRSSPQCKQVVDAIIQSKEVQSMLTTQQDRPMTRSAIANYFAAEEEDDATVDVGLSLGDEERIVAVSYTHLTLPTIYPV